MNEQMIVRVDLEQGRVSREPVPDDLRLMYMGGEGINARLLWDHFRKVDPKIDPLSPDNVLIAGSGPFVGSSLGAGGKMKFTYKSPAYNIYGDTSAGGGFGAQLRFGGVDHLVITGKAERPVYLWIKDGEVEVRDARHLTGMSVCDMDSAIKQELGDDAVETACSGPAGQNLARIAAIMVSAHRAAGRGGGGCLMGAKNLRAIAARGSRGIAVHDPAAFLLAMDDFLVARQIDRDAREQFMRYGTLSYTRRFHGMGFNTYRNGQGHEMPDEMVEKVDHNWYRDNLGVRSTACSPGCVFACNHWHLIKGNESPAAALYAGEWGTRPEFGAANPFGASCDVRDMSAIAHMNKMCNEYGLDTMEIGMGLSFLMELWDREIITLRDTEHWTGEPLSLEWGNYRAMESLITATAFQSNKLGQMLQGGVYRMALIIGEVKGVSVLRYASYGKGGATHEGPVRPWPALGFACAVSPIGAHHLKGLGVNPPTSQKYFGTPEAGDSFSIKLRGAGHALSENFTAVSNSLGLCLRLGGRDPEIVSVDLIAQALRALTGLSVSGDDLLLAAERVVNIQKAFNSRLGLRREHDTVCERWLNEPQLEGAAKGMKVGNYLESAKDEYYQYRGWDRASALQTGTKLAHLGMEDVAEVLRSEGAIAG